MRGTGARHGFSPTELHEEARRARPAELLQTLDLVSCYHVTSKPISPSENVKDLKKELNLCHNVLPKGESGLFCDVTMSEGATL